MEKLSLSLPGVDQLDLDSIEVRHIARHEGEALLQCCGCDHGITHALRNRHVHDGPAPGGFRCKREHLAIELLEHRFDPGA